MDLFQIYLQKIIILYAWQVVVTINCMRVQLNPFMTNPRAVVVRDGDMSIEFSN